MSETGPPKSGDSDLEMRGSKLKHGKPPLLGIWEGVMGFFALGLKKKIVE